MQGRLATLEGAEAPFAEISDQLTRLHAQKDATVETVFARLAPLEARLAELEAGAGASATRAALLDRFAERLEAVQGRLAALRRAPRTPFAEISEQLTRLYAQKDATVETVFARLAPLEARLAELEAGLGAAGTARRGRPARGGRRPAQPARGAALGAGRDRGGAGGAAGGRPARAGRSPRSPTG